ncbi:MAG TPA: hypothetical protein VIW94_01665 [Acidimicrobiia bacterium]
MASARRVGIRNTVVLICATATASANTPNLRLEDSGLLESLPGRGPQCRVFRSKPPRTFRVDLSSPDDIRHGKRFRNQMVVPYGEHIVEVEFDRLCNYLPVSPDDRRSGRTHRADDE